MTTVSPSCHLGSTQPLGIKGALGGGHDDCGQGSPLRPFSDRHSLCDHLPGGCLQERQLELGRDVCDGTHLLCLDT